MQGNGAVEGKPVAVLTAAGYFQSELGRDFAALRHTINNAIDQSFAGVLNVDAPLAGDVLLLLDHIETILNRAISA